MPAGALGRVGAGGDQDQVGAVAVGDERLRAVDDVVVAVADRRGLQVGQVGSAAGLGHRDRGDQLAGAEPGSQRSRCSSVVSSTRYGAHDVGVDAEAGRERRREPGQLLGHHRGEPVVARRRRRRTPPGRAARAGPACPPRSTGPAGSACAAMNSLPARQHVRGRGTP